MKKFATCMLVAIFVTCGLTPVGSSAAPGQVAMIGTTPRLVIRVVDANLIQGLWNQEKYNKVTNSYTGQFYDNRNLLYWLTRAGRAYYPDVMAVQNLDYEPDQAPAGHTCANTAVYLQSVSGQAYEYYTSRKRGGACVIWRDDRFNALSTAGGLGNFGTASDQTVDCVNAQESQTTVGVRLQDLRTSKVISVASVHMSGNECVPENLGNIRDWAANTTGPSLILGDFNIHHDPSVPPTGGYATMKSTFEGAGFHEERIWPVTGLDYFWWRGFGGISNKTLLDFPDCKGAGFPSGRDFSDHQAGFADAAL